MSEDRELKAARIRRLELPPASARSPCTEVEVCMSTRPVLRPDSPESKSDASPSGPGLTPRSASLPREQTERIAQRAYEIAERRGFAAGHELDDWLQAEREIEWGTPRNTPPDNPFDAVRTFSNE